MWTLPRKKSCQKAYKSAKLTLFYNHAWISFRAAWSMTWHTQKKYYSKVWTGTVQRELGLQHAAIKYELRHAGCCATSQTWVSSLGSHSSNSAPKWLHVPPNILLREWSWQLGIILNCNLQNWHCGDDSNIWPGLQCQAPAKLQNHQAVCCALTSSPCCKPKKTKQTRGNVTTWVTQWGLGAMELFLQIFRLHLAFLRKNNHLNAT